MSAGRGKCVWLAVLCASVLVSLVLDAPALALRGHVFGKSFGGPGSGQSQFEGASGVAVNEESGDVYVVDQGNGRVEYFTSGGVFIGEFDGSGTLGEGTPAGGGGKSGEVLTGKFSGPDSIAVDNTCRQREERTEEALSSGACKALDPSNGDVYVVDDGHSVLDKFGPTGEYLGQVSEVTEGPFTLGTFGVAVDSSGQVWLAESHRDSEGNRVQDLDRFSGALTYLGAVQVSVSFGFFEHPGLAVNSNDDLYVFVDFQGTRVLEFSGSGRLENPGLGPKPPSGLAAESTTGDVYIAGGPVERFDPGGRLVEGFGSHGGSLGVNAASGEVFVAESSGLVDQFVLEPPGSPTVEGESVLTVGSDNATVTAEVNPRGATTGYIFEYGLCSTPSTCAGSEYEGSVPAGGGGVGSDFEVHSVPGVIQGLQAHATYHARVVAHNEVGGKANVVEGSEETFTTQAAAAGATLPDGRAWELVSPADKHGGLIQPIEEQGIVQAAALGGAIAYLSSVPTESSPEGFSNSVQVMSVRSTDGWDSADLALPHNEPTGKSVGFGQEYRMFSEDLSLGGAQPLGPYTQISEAASEQTPYLRSNFAAGGAVCTGACYRPLVTGCPAEGELCVPAVEAAADVPPGTAFGGQAAGKCVEAGNPVTCGVQLRGGTPDLGHIVLESHVSLVSGSPPGLYEWSKGSLSFIGISAGSTGFKAISADGSLVVFNGAYAALKGLLVNDVATGEVAQVGSGETSIPGEETFLGASADGRRVFYLGPDRELDECEVIVGPGEFACHQSDLTPGHPDVLGLVGASSDGSQLYFVANGALVGGAVEGACEPRKFVIDAPTQCNLYELHFDGTRWEPPQLIRVISGEDFPDWSDVRTQHVGRASADGEWLEFMSRESVTGYDNRDAMSGKRDEEVFLYHAAAAGSLACVSCNPTGARPHGVPYVQLSNGLAGGDRVWDTSMSLAGNVPGWTPYADELATYDSRFLGDSGRLFFNSSDALVAGDVNAGEDVYEFEPVGVGGCSAESTGFVASVGGCVGLVSSGLSGFESGFLDASVSGGDVFFLTSAKLVSGDRDNAVDVYDAHECTTVSPCIPSAAAPSPVCGSGDECKGAPAVPAGSLGVFGSPLSSVFVGPGNASSPVAGGGGSKPKPRVLTRAEKLAKALKVCAKKPKSKRAGCVRVARREFGPVRKAKKSVVRGGRLVGRARVGAVGSVLRSGGGV